MATSYSPITQQQFLHILLQEEKIAVASLQMTETQLLNYKHSHIDAHPFPAPRKKKGVGPKEEPFSWWRGTMDRNATKRTREQWLIL